VKTTQENMVCAKKHCASEKVLWHAWGRGLYHNKTIREKKKKQFAYFAHGFVGVKKGAISP